MMVGVRTCWHRYDYENLGTEFSVVFKVSSVDMFSGKHVRCF